MRQGCEGGAVTTKQEAGNRQLPVGPVSIAGLQARSCTLVAEAVIERKKAGRRIQWKEKWDSNRKQKRKKQFDRNSSKRNKKVRGKSPHSWRRAEVWSALTACSAFGFISEWGLGHVNVEHYFCTSFVTLNSNTQVGKIQIPKASL